MEYNFHTLCICMPSENLLSVEGYHILIVIQL